MNRRPDPHRSLVLAATGLLASLALVACMKPNPLLDTLAEDESGTGTETGEGEDEGEDETEDSGMEQQAMPDLGADSCELFELYEPMCDTCLAGSCCDLALACAGDSDCLCVLDCELAGTPPGQCNQACGAKPGELPAHAALVECRNDACADSC